MRKLVAASTFGLAAAALLLLARRRRRGAAAPPPRRFADFDESVPEETQQALAKHRWLPLRHTLLKRRLSPAMLEDKFEDIVAAFAPQQVDYSNTAYAKDHWQLSCFTEYSNGVAAGKVDLDKGKPLAAVCEPIYAECDAVFLDWWDELNPLPKGATRSLTRLQSFVTRYTSTPDETHLPRHIDGAAVDGSLVLGLPTYERFTGGGLTVWDGEGEAEVFQLPICPGDVCLLGPRVWHQSNPVTSGIRWVIVIFYAVSVCRNRDGAAREAEAEAEAGVRSSRDVRNLLAKRMVDAAKRAEPARMTTAASKSLRGVA